MFDDNKLTLPVTIVFLCLGSVSHLSTMANESVQTSSIFSVSENTTSYFWSVTGLIFMDFAMLMLISWVSSSWMGTSFWALTAVNALIFGFLALVTRLYCLTECRYMLGKTLTLGTMMLAIQLALFLQFDVQPVILFKILLTEAVVGFVMTLIHHRMSRPFYLCDREGLYFQLESGLKRSMDLMLSTILLVALIPIFLLIVLGIYLNDGGTPLYKQQRIGIGELPFTLFKFRSMKQNAAELKKELITDQGQEQTLFKMAKDPRITKWGQFLRNFSLDELPQLINVIRGDMSLVGPRPPVVSEFNQMNLVHRSKFKVLPGMTGLWQIAGRVRNERHFDDVARYDLAYINHWSLISDLNIMLKTVSVVLGQKGAC